jgi:hypothetical protein
MDWLTGNLIWIVLIAVCVGMHLFGHGGHGGHGSSAGSKPKEQGPEDRGAGAAAGQHH